jgi:hypothetical protein
MASDTGKLSIDDLLKLEDYAARRAEFRREAIARKKARTVHLGPHLTLLFEDRLLVQYQVQEMLRIEKIFEKAAIQGELDAYNPLIPDGTNWKATCLLEYEDADERRIALARLRGIESRVYVRIGERDSVFAIADEDLDRSNEEKTSAVHFLRFELAEPQAQAVGSGAELVAGVDHPAYRHEARLADEMRRSLAADLR